MKKITVNPNRIALDEAYMRMAEIWALRSKANRNQVGALIVKDRQVISDGYNGMPAGEVDDTCEFHDEQGNLVTKPEVLHAESNALMKLAENGGVGSQGATLYVTLSPCFECAKLIKQAKIERVVFRHQYRKTDGIDFLKRRGVDVHHLPAGDVASPKAPRIAEPVRKSIPQKSVEIEQKVPQAEMHQLKSAFDDDDEVQRLLAEHQAALAGETVKKSALDEGPAYSSPFE